MPRVEKEAIASDNALGWIGIGLGLLAIIILDKGSAPHKWHAAVMWTFCAFFTVLVFGRKKRGSWVFWSFWAACLAAHVFGMWVIFGRLFPYLILGTLYVVPLAFIEGILLLGAFLSIEHKVRKTGKAGKSRKTGTPSKTLARHSSDV